VKFAAISPDGERVFLNFANCPAGEVGQIWKLSSSDPPLILTHDKFRSLSSAAFTPDGKLLVGDCRMKNTHRPVATVKHFWNAATGASENHLTHWEPAWGVYQVDQSTLSLCEPMTKPTDGEVQVFDRATYKYHWAQRILIPQYQRRLIAIDPRGVRTVTRDREEFNVYRPGTIRVWKVSGTDATQVLGQPLTGSHAVLTDKSDVVLVLNLRRLECWHLSGHVPEHLLQLSQADRPPTTRELKLWVELRTGLALSDAGEIYAFDEAEGQDKARELDRIRKASPEPGRGLFSESSGNHADSL
jgi:hypothetical protein